MLYCNIVKTAFTLHKFFMLKIIMLKFKTDSMNKLSIFSFLLLILTFAACKNEAKPTENNTIANPTAPVAEFQSSTAAITFEHKEISRRQVDAKDKNTFAAGYMVKYPSVKTSNSTLAASVKKWASEFVSAQAGFTGVVDPETGYAPFIAMAREAARNDKNLKFWELEIKDNIIYNTNKISSIRMDAITLYTTTVPNRASALSSFDVQTGELLTLEKLTKDKQALLALCEKNYRITKADAFKKGFDFKKDSPFKLPQNFAILPNGVLFHYNSNEVASQNVGDAEFTIPFSELENILDLKKYL